MLPASRRLYHDTLDQEAFLVGWLTAEDLGWISESDLPYPYFGA